MSALRCVLVAGVLAAVYAASGAVAIHGEPWHTVASSEVVLEGGAVPGEVGPPVPGLIGGGGFDLSADGRFTARVSAAPEDHEDCDSEVCFFYYHTDRLTGLSTIAGVAWDDEALSVILPRPTISDDGRYLGYTDWETGGSFVYDSELGTSTRVDVDSNGTPADLSPGGQTLSSGVPAVSPGGRFTAFATRASNLVPGDTATCTSGQTTQNCSDVFVHDSVTGETERVSVATGGAQADGDSANPTISDDGRFVAFASLASNLDAGEPNEFCQFPPNCRDIYVHDRDTGETNLVSANTDGQPGDGQSSSPSISANGRFVVFTSEAEDLSPDDGNDLPDVFLRDLQAGTTEIVSVNSSGQQPSDGFGAGEGTVSADGSRIAFSSSSSNLEPGAPTECDFGVRCQGIFVRERLAGMTYRVDRSLNGSYSSARSSTPVLSAGGRHVLFGSGADNLLPGVDGGVFIAEREGFVWGDFRCDGSTGPDDALALLATLSGADPAPEDCIETGTSVQVGGETHGWGDFNCDGIEDAADIVPVLLAAAGAPAAGDCPAIGLDVQLLS